MLPRVPSSLSYECFIIVELLGMLLLQICSTFHQTDCRGQCLCNVHRGCFCFGNSTKPGHCHGFGQAR